MAELKLRNCPFCGRKPEINDLGRVKILSCEYSKCMILPRIVYTCRPEKEKEAIEAWNKRADLPEPPESEVQEDARTD